MLAEESGGIAELAHTKLKRSYSQVSQWLNASKDSKSGKARSMTSQTARWIERQCGKEEGWMDQPITAQKLSIDESERFIEDMRAIPPSFQEHVVWVAADLRRRWEAIRPGLRHAISAPPKDMGLYTAWGGQHRPVD